MFSICVKEFRIIYEIWFISATLDVLECEPWLRVTPLQLDLSPENLYLVYVSSSQW